MALTSNAIKGYNGKLHLCADGWTSPNVISFVGLTVHWAGSDGIRSTTLDFVKYVVRISSQLCETQQLLCS
jgi:hypothetical protein